MERGAASDKPITAQQRSREIREIAANGLPPGESHAMAARRLGLTGEYLSVALARFRANDGITAQRGRPQLSQPDETPREARARVRRDIATGVRCARCWLLMPCDHGTLAAVGAAESPR